jgi:hypothetical protein
MPLALGALTDYVTVSSYPGLTTVAQPFCEQLINVVSGKIRDYLNRTPYYQTYSIANPDKVRAYGGPVLRLNSTPIALGGTINTPPTDNNHGCITQISVDNWPENPGGGYVIPNDTYEFDAQDGAEAGKVYCANNWNSTGLLESNLNFTNRVSPGTEEATVWAVYSGGWITKPQSYGGAGGQTWPWPGAGVLVPLGTLLLTGVSPNQILWQSVPNGLGLASGDTADTTGGSMPSFAASPSIGAQQLDGTVLWMALGKAGVPGFAGAGTVLLDGAEMVGGARIALPDDLEQACIEEIKARIRGSGRDPMAKSQSLLGTSVSYRDPTVSGLCPDAQALCAPYRRI